MSIVNDISVRSDAASLTKESVAKLEKTNDIHRMIKNRSKYYKTVFIRYRAKQDEALKRET